MFYNDSYYIQARTDLTFTQVIEILKSHHNYIANLGNRIIEGPVNIDEIELKASEFASDQWVIYAPHFRRNTQLGDVRRKAYDLDVDFDSRFFDPNKMSIEDIFNYMYDHNYFSTDDLYNMIMNLSK